MDIIKNKILEWQNHYLELEKQLQDPALFKNAQQLKNISQRYNQIKEILNSWQELQETIKNITETTPLLTDADPQIQLLAKNEIALLEKKKNQLKEKIKSFLDRPSSLDQRKVMVEIRAGTGGEEAGLFAANLFRMYSLYAQNKKWTTTLINTHPTGLGGFKEVIFEIKGDNVYPLLKYESGVHRVQRIPKTEKSGRIHTSTASVAVLVEPEPAQVHLDPKDLKTDIFRASGHGGQNVNKVETAVRITHLPTGISAICQNQRTQQQNRLHALSILRTRLWTKLNEEKQKKLDKERKAQIGTALRAEKIRTYNFPQDRVTDHRLSKSWYHLDKIMDGEIESIIKACQEFYH